MKLRNILIFSFFNLLILSACSDMLNTESDLVEFAEENTLNHPTDSVYSVMGIVGRMQHIADRTVILGEVRGDLVEPTDAASADLKRLAAFDMGQQNKYNKVSDYYAVINNCNYFLANVDTTLQRRGRQLFKYEYAAVKAFRAWTYLELVKIYGQVPLVLKPLMTEREAQEAAEGPLSTIQEVCNYFITDLTPYALTDLPSYENIDSHNPDRFFIPVRLLLGDLCLWAGRYEEAARWYNDYLNDKDHPVQQPYQMRTYWRSVTDYQYPSSAYSVLSLSELLTYIPMESRIFDGVVSDLSNLFSSTKDNNYFFQLAPSQGMRNLSAAQIYCTEYKNDSGTQVDTVYAPRSGFTDNIYIGDLRFASNYTLMSTGSQDEYSEYSSQRQVINKFNSSMVPTYRITMVYLRYAEALNRAGLPQSAMAILKYGLCQENITLYVDSLEQEKAGQLIKFDDNIFTRETTIGIHSRGSGDSHCNAYYVLPQPPTPLPTRADTVAYQIPRVEDLIINEMALEGAFEGNRFYDLMRVALRRNDPAYLADPISRRSGKQDAALRALLMDPTNWYLPK